MAGPIVVTQRIVIPESAIETKAVRSGGPGGQNVNKLATKIQMWIDLGAIPGFSDEDRERVRTALKSRLDARGRLLVSSQATRDQARNVEDAADRAAELIRAALARPKVRRRTRPTRASAEERREAKRRRAERLRGRRVDWGDR